MVTDFTYSPPSKGLIKIDRSTKKGMKKMKGRDINRLFH